VRAAAQKGLLKKGREHDIFPFLRRSLKFLPESKSPHVLETLYALDAERGTSVAQEFAENGLPGNRAKALELVAKAAVSGEGRDDEMVTLMARGMLDKSPQVGIAAAQGLAQLKDPRATPVLIGGLDSPYDDVRMACQAALSSLWGSTSPPPEREAWRDYWHNRRGNVADPIDPDSLERLYDEAEQGQPAYYLKR